MEVLESLGNEKETNKTTNLSNTGKILVGLTGGIAVGLSVICYPFVSPALRKFCLPYVPATTEQIKNIFKALENHRGTLIDLGSGDGRIVIEAAKRGYISHGVELNPWLVFYSKINSFKNGQSKRTEFFRKDLWQFSLKEYDNIVIFGVEQMMADLEKKFMVECSQNSHIIVCRFPLPNLMPIQTLGAGIDTVWIYKIPKPS